MSRVGLISCVSKKQSTAAQAKDLYCSALFTKSREYVQQRCDSWFILSAKYGLLEPNEFIEPYEETLNAKSAKERFQWADDVWSSLRSRIHPGDDIVVLAGERYRERLVPLISAHGCRVDLPMQGLGIGRQLQWLSNQQSQPHRQRDVERLYQALHCLETSIDGMRLLSACTGSQGWPCRGVYLFFEPGEVRRGSVESRVVRVGTHGVSRGSKATLWNRLRTHRGSNDGLGNHRGSVFRLHVGAAMSAANPRIGVPTWGIGSSADAQTRAAEQNLERLVSRHIGAMHVLWLAVDDEAGPTSDRAYIERNLIGLLVGKSGPVDTPADNWLGLFSPNVRIRDSGLWNLDFLEYRYDSDFLDVLDEYVLITTKKRPQPSNSIAPQGWSQAEA
ncbi:MAG: hypothetical protein JSS27_21550 [Planctomycetes bacterium]|nr:hypothetical protein [Planctomycetota bacterium]